MCMDSSALEKSPMINPTANDSDNEPLTPAEGAIFCFWLMLTTNNTFSSFTGPLQDQFAFHPPDILDNFIPMITKPVDDPKATLEAKFKIFKDQLKAPVLVLSTDKYGSGKPVPVEISNAAALGAVRRFFQNSSQLAGIGDGDYDPLQVCHSLKHFLDVIPPSESTPDA